MNTVSGNASSPFAHKGEEVSWRVLDDVVDIDGHLDFVRSLADHPSLSEKIRADVHQRLRYIAEKQKETGVNLCVVGGAGSSKSAFINALVGENIFTSTAIADSSLIPVVVEYLDSPAIFIQDNTGRYTLESPADMETLNRRLTEIATDPARIPRTSMIRVGIPAPSLKEGLRVIDTPAYTDEKAWDRPVVRELVGRISDLCVILTPAIQAVSQDSLEFVESLPQMLVRNAMVVATHIEHISEREIEDIRLYVRKRFKSSLDVDLPVLAVASSTMAGVTGDMSGEKMVHLTSESVATIRRHATAGRHKIQARRMIRLVDTLYRGLSETVQAERETMTYDLRRIEQMRKIPLDTVVKEVKRSQVSRLHILSSYARQAYTSLLDRSAETAVEKIMAYLANNVKTTTDLKAFLSSGLEKQCSEIAGGMAATVNSFRQEMLANIRNALNDTHTSIREKFSHIEALQFDPAGRSSRQVTTAEVSDIDVSAHSRSLGKKDDMLGNGLIGGSIGGAVVGQILIPIPVVGALIGGLIGFFGGGFLFDVNIDKEKGKVSADLRPKLTAYFKEVKENTRQGLSDIAGRATDILSEEIDRYLDIYKEGIDRDIAETQKHRRAIELRLAQTDRLLQALRSRSIKMSKAAEKL